MKMFKIFAREDDGAVTVDWVVLTAALVSLALTVLLSVGRATTGLADKISTKVTSHDTLTF